jgi:hypothetical protein
MMQFENPNPKTDMHAGSVIIKDVDTFAIRTWRSFSSATGEYDGNETHWWINRENNTTYLMKYRRRSRHLGWLDFSVDEFNRHDPKALIPDDHIREARHHAKTTLGLNGPYRRLKLKEMYGRESQPSA